MKSIIEELMSSKFGPNENILESVAYEYVHYAGIVRLNVQIKKHILQYIRYVVKRDSGYLEKDIFFDEIMVWRNRKGSNKAVLKMGLW